MPGGAVIAAALTGGVGRPYGLYLDGLDVITFVDRPTISLVEAPPGGVSALTFTINDPTGAIPIPVAGAEIRMQDLVGDYPLFLGELDDFSASSTSGAVGRKIKVSAIGVESVIDWVKIPAGTLLGNNLNFASLVEDIVYIVSTLGPQSALTAPIPASTDPYDGDATHPIGSFANAFSTFKDWGGVVGGGPIAVGPGDLRAALETAIKNTWRGSLLSRSIVVPYPDLVVTVDFYRRLRVFTRTSKPDDYTDLVISDTLTGALAAADLEYEVHPGDVARAVYVVGGNAAGTGWVTDGSGIVGRQEIIEDPLSTDAAHLAQTGAQFLASEASLVRGTLVLEAYTPPVGTVHPASLVTITDANVGLAAQTYQIASITKSFRKNAREQDWAIDFGGRRPNYVEALQRGYSADRSWSTRPIRGF